MTVLTENQKEQILARVKILIPEESDNDLLSQLVDDASEYVAAYTNRTCLPDQILKQVGDLAIVYYNRAGAEGDSSRSEGGESYSFEASPEYIFSVLRNYRLARSGGCAKKTETTTNASTS